MVKKLRYWHYEKQGKQWVVQAVPGHFLKLNFTNFYVFVKKRTRHKSKNPTPRQGLSIVKQCKRNVNSSKPDIICSKRYVFQRLDEIYRPAFQSRRLQFCTFCRLIRSRKVVKNTKENQLKNAA
jgi:hypothetical protein